MNTAAASSQRNNQTGRLLCHLSKCLHLDKKIMSVHRAGLLGQRLTSIVHEVDFNPFHAGYSTKRKTYNTIIAAYLD